MSIVDKSDEEIIKIADPIWDNMVRCSNMKDYGGFTRDLSSQMLYGANEVELGKQWASNKLISSLKMGDISKDEMAVVDNTLRVKGVKNLRVADASVLPHQTSGNTQSPVFMIGERASDFILQSWNS